MENFLEPVCFRFKQSLLHYKTKVYPEKNLSDTRGGGAGIIKRLLKFPAQQRKTLLLIFRTRL